MGRAQCPAGIECLVGIPNGDDLRSSAHGGRGDAIPCSWDNRIRMRYGVRRIRRDDARRLALEPVKIGRAWPRRIHTTTPA